MIQINLITKKKQIHRRYMKQTYGYQGERGRLGDTLGTWD